MSLILRVMAYPQSVRRSRKISNKVNQKYCGHCVYYRNMGKLSTPATSSVYNPLNKFQSGVPSRLDLVPDDQETFRVKTVFQSHDEGSDLVGVRTCDGQWGGVTTTTTPVRLRLSHDSSLHVDTKVETPSVLLPGKREKEGSSRWRPPSSRTPASRRDPWDRDSVS